MRICTNCGAQIPDGDLFCPSCLAEVQLVPDYETLESRVQENKRKEEEEAARRQQELQRAAELARQKKRRRRIAALLIVLAIIAVIATMLTMRFMQINRQNNSFDWQFEQAENAFNAGDMNLALEHVRNALGIEPENESAGILLARIYEETDNPDKAAQEYERVIGLHPSSDDAYARLVPLYQAQESYDAMQTLLANCTDDDIRAKYADYVTYEPVFDLKEGQYESVQELNFTGFEEGAGDVYYTVDGTIPSEKSQRYSEPITIDEGNTTVQAFYLSPAGIPSHVVKHEYRIRLRKAEAPLITPASGTYRSESAVWITVEVPDGYEAHYAFDVRPTAASERYDGPVKMPAGDHVFYAVLVDENGKEGEIGSATYVYRRLTPTPAPTPTPTPTAAPTVTPTTVVTPTPTATPTPTEEPEVIEIPDDNAAQS